MREWLNERAWLVALTVFTLAVIPGFLRVEYVNDQTQQQASQNSELIECLTTYAVEMTDALQDRDSVTIIARGASVDLWRTFRDLIVNPLPGDEGRKVFLQALRTYLRTLAQIGRTAALNPYPDPTACFADIGQALGVDFELASYSTPERSYCLDKRVTIKGTRHDDIIHGTDGPDVIRAYGGSDLIVSGAGRDVICAGWGPDIINAGRGFDTVACGPGDDSAQQAERRRHCE